MPHAIVVAHGQPSDPDPAEAALAAFAAKVDALAEHVTVSSATLAKPGALEAKLDGLPENSVIYPLFMAKGWFVTSALPKRVGDHRARILDPLGIDPDLPALTANALEAKLREEHWAANATDLVIAAHGSGRSRNPSAVANEFANRLGRQVAFQSIRVGFVEEPPSIAEAARDASNQAICLPFFACTGGHVLEDVPEELERAQFKGIVMPVVGELAPIQRQIAQKVTEAFASA
ncbi:MULTISPECIES: CbiX/SirB N-terminal domain-containing protein [unclassified Ruegeria]|uniref:CbiX/SirB N-terminal domain-containing protein n=1 Tax=unclassified Ruegeria TaxID=2625375 RepID=UPI001488CEFB|nr:MULTISPECIES: CbiX/SirB N-terminal domain-containing protein [unclassified Ruegeria]NOD74853.1 cobalamin biosynthesis protein CbiX [Ruegeria sp. HKCCD4332]NOD86804.1 cobalamin biosynthesis protein CbiX [Ruegeria sp. HKCCD4318]NOE12359.1 cobalamin biosynthesis protein CbiX [Ruegeria sp. HKCCD4318-2]NOG09476.1 CbiX/SirB N-terminal domain-containing protein [Ruegeria sp. HKCCD4315]